MVQTLTKLSKKTIIKPMNRYQVAVKRILEHLAQIELLHIVTDSLSNA